jgi:hypothetical protein
MQALVGCTTHTSGGARNLKRALSAAEAQDLDPDDPKWPAAWAQLIAEIESQPSAPHGKGGGNIAERFEVTELAPIPFN